MNGPIIRKRILIGCAVVIAGALLTLVDQTVRDNRWGVALIVLPAVFLLTGTLSFNLHGRIKRRLLAAHAAVLLLAAAAYLFLVHAPARPYADRMPEYRAIIRQAGSPPAEEGFLELRDIVPIRRTSGDLHFDRMLFAAMPRELRPAGPDDVKYLMTVEYERNEQYYNPKSVLNDPQRQRDVRSEKKAADVRRSASIELEFIDRRTGRIVERRTWLNAPPPVITTPYDRATDQRMPKEEMREYLNTLASRERARAAAARNNR